MHRLEYQVPTANLTTRMLTNDQWLDEVQASMDTVIHDFLPVDPVLLLEIRVETRLNVLHDGLPATDAVSQRSTRDEN